MILNKVEKREIDLYLKRYDFSAFFSNKNVLITGYKGLIGTGIAKWLLRMNDLHSCNLKLFLSSRNPSSIPDWIEKDDNVVFTKYMKEDCENLDVIIHLAAPTDKQYFINNPIDSIDSIYEGTKYYLNLASKQQNDCRFLYASSVEAYGCPTGNKLLNESYAGEIDSFDIRNGYPLGKKAAEFLCFSFYEKYRLKTFVVRPSSVQGLFQHYDETRIFNEILRCLIEEKDFIMKSDGLTKKSIIYSLDAISALMLIIQKGQPGQAYNVTNSSIYFSMNDYVERVFRQFNSRLQLIHIKADNSKEGFLPRVEYNLSTKKIEAIGWKPFADLYHIYSTDLERFMKVGK